MIDPSSSEEETDEEAVEESHHHHHHHPSQQQPRASRGGVQDASGSFGGPNNFGTAPGGGGGSSSGSANAAAASYGGGGGAANSLDVPQSSGNQPRYRSDRIFVDRPIVQLSWSNQRTRKMKTGAPLDRCRDVNAEEAHLVLLFGHDGSDVGGVGGGDRNESRVKLMYTRPE